jgi:hypothetical protein
MTSDNDADDESDLRMVLVHDADAVYAPEQELRCRNLLLAGFQADRV